MRIRHLAGIAAAAAKGERDRLPALYAAAVGDGIPVADLFEATLQVFLFAGYPRTIDAFSALRGVVGDEAIPPLEPERADLSERGLATFEAVYGPHTQVVIDKLTALHPDFARFVLRDAYGQVLGRPYLSLQDRELLAVAMLAVMDLPPQLRAHVRGARRAGAPESAITACLKLSERGGPGA